MLAREETRGVVTSLEKASFSLQLTYADPLCGGLKQGGVWLDKTTSISYYGRRMAVFEGLAPDLLVDARMSVLFALIPKLKGRNPHRLEPTCLEVFSGGNCLFALQIPYQIFHSPNAHLVQGLPSCN